MSSVVTASTRVIEQRIELGLAILASAEILCLFLRALN